MTVDCFWEAIRSVRGWPGVVALFGGNPCSHPQFEEIAKIMEREIPDQRKRGLWSNDTLSHADTVRRVFYPNGRFNMNAHADPAAAKRISLALPGKLIPNSDRVGSRHAAILADYRDLGLTEAEWIAKREACDINQKWSGAIVEREGRAFAYFCEVAAAIDGVRGENHGVAAMPGWWKSLMPVFSGQVRNCCDRGCGVPLRIKGHEDREDVYDVTPGWANTLPDTKAKIFFEVHQSVGEQTHESTDYMLHRAKKGKV